MEFKDFTARALATESKPDTVIIDQTNFQAVTGAIIAAGNLLDLIKKDAYYGLPKTQLKLNQRADKLDKYRGMLEMSTRHAVSGYYQAPDLTVVGNVNPRVMHGIIGTVTESVEMLEALNTAMRNGTDIDGVNLLEEVGDLAWYVAIVIDALGGDWNKILEANLAKLAKRYAGNTFDAQATINRDVDAERTLLEDHLTT